MFFDPKKLRRAKTEDIRNVLFSTPKHAWKAPKEAVDGVDFKVHSALELDRVYRAFSAQFRGLGDIVPPRLERWLRVRSAGAFTRTEELGADQADGGSTFALESAERGAVYVDVKDKTYLHFGLEQLPQAGLSATLLEDPPEWKVATTKSKLTLSARGSLSLDVVIEHGQSGHKVGDVAARILAACLPGIDGLAKLGLPFAQIAAAGVPSSVETWLVNAKGQRGERLARHRVSNVKVGAIDPSAFEMPKGYRNLRDAKPGDKRTWHAVGSPHRRTRRAKPARRASKARAFASVTQYQATLGQLVPPTLVVSPEPAFPECMPATLHVSSALEIRQALLDGIGFMVNVMSRRLDTVTGARVDADDPENTDVELTIDWLDQLEQFHREQGDVGDGLFCLLRDPPREDDPTSGGEGLLDRMAATLARDLVAAEEPIPLGGDDDPVDLPAAIEDEITALAGDDAIAADQRFDALLPESRAAVREAVLRQRIATLDYLFDGDFGERLWPHVIYDLVHVKLQLEQLAVEFADDVAIRRLVITLRDNDSNKPRIELELALARFDATLSMDRWPGGWFWVTAAGVLVALSIVGSLAVTGLILTLIGLGPVGWLVLLLLISQAPVATVAGGAVLLAAVTYLVWDATALRLTLEQPVLHASFDPDRANDPDEVVLDPDRVTLDGEITVSVSSEIPSGIHRLFDAIVNLAVPHFDTNVREVLESVIEGGLAGALRRLPHFLLSPPFDAQVPVGVTGADFDHFDADAPKHELLEMGTNGVAQWLLAEAAVTRMAFPFADFGPTCTQVDRDLREALAQRMQQVETAGDPPYLGYAISQNQLNGNVYAQWLAGRFVRDYDSTQVEDAFATLIAALPGSADVTSREVHAWAAAAPIVSVTPRAYLEQEARPYLAVSFPDIRVCIAGVAGKAATLELQCAAEAIAHLGLGGLGNGDVRTLFSLERDFVHVLFDDRTEFMRVSPVSTQGIVAQGPVFEAIAAMDDAGRLQLLENLQPVLATAARRLLRRNSHEQVVFLPETPRVDQQVYDGVALANIAPRRASLLVVISTFGAMRIMLPRFDAEGNTEYFGMDFDALTCEEGIEFRSNV